MPCCRPNFIKLGVWPTRPGGGTTFESETPTLAQCFQYFFAIIYFSTIFKESGR